MKIRKAVVTAAGYGTRFLPMSKAIPKEMLPIIDKPVIQYVIEGLAKAGIEQIILVTGWHKRAIEDHFDRHLELEQKLKENGKEEQLAAIIKLSEMVEIVSVRQKVANGNGGAILAAKNVVGNEPFIVMWGDDFIIADPLQATQLIQAFEKYQTTILGGVTTTNPDDAKKYGFAGGEEIEPGVIKVKKFVEKPKWEERPSNLAIVSGFVFTPEIFDALESYQPEEGKELVYVDGVNELVKRGREAYAIEIKNARYYNCGDVTEYLKTNVEMALKRDDIKDEFGQFIKETAEKL